MSKNNKTSKVPPVQSQTKPTSKKESKESKLQKLVKGNPHFNFIENGKIKCSLTGHQFAPTLENFQTYLKSKSFKKGLESQFDISEYEEFLVPFKGNPHFLFCRLTGAKLPKKKTAIQRHVNSRKFKFRMEQVLAEGDQEGKERAEEGEGEELIDQHESEEEEEVQQKEEEEEEEDEAPPKAKNGGKKKK